MLKIISFKYVVNNYGPISIAKIITSILQQNI
uniref:Uncharacterized protein n=1 Tax=Solanum lycopersicum TaxID=4081 RepID=A0A3Q7ER44_SOLLC